jgi:hypothetical protein
MEESVHCLTEHVPHSGDGSEGVGARPQVRDFP